MKRNLLFVGLVFIALLGACKKDKDAQTAPHATSVSLEKTSVSMLEGESIKLTNYLVIEPAEVADTATVEWSSSDPSIASVGKTGKVTAVYEGNAVITAKVHDLTAECKVRVSAVPIESFEVEAPNVAYSNVPFVVSITNIVPSTASPRHVVWSSNAKYDDKEVIPVFNTESGEWIVNTPYEGDIKLTATVDKVSVSASFKIGRNKVTSIELSGSSSDVELRIPSNSTLSFDYALKLTDADFAASYSEIKFKPVSGDYEGKVEIDSKAKQIKTTASAVEGTTIAKFTAYVVEPEGDRSLGRSYTIRVTKAIPLTSFDLDATSLSLNLGESKSLKPISLAPTNGATEEIEWTSSNTSILRVNKVAGDPCYAELVASATNGGTVTVTAKTSTTTRTCTVTVTKIDVTSVSFPSSQSQIVCFQSKQYSLSKATVLPSNASLPKVTYSITKNGVTSSDLKILEGTSALTVTTGADAEGEYKITATADGKSTSMTVAVVSEEMMGNLVMNEKTIFKCPGYSYTVTPSVLCSNLSSLPSFVSGKMKFVVCGNGNLAYGLGYTFKEKFSSISNTPLETLTLHWSRNTEGTLYGESLTFKLLIYDYKNNVLESSQTQFGFYNSYVYLKWAADGYSSSSAGTSGVFHSGDTFSVKRNRGGDYPAYYIYITYYSNATKSATQNYQIMKIPGATRSTYSEKDFFYSWTDGTIASFTFTIHYLDTTY